MPENGELIREIFQELKTIKLYKFQTMKNTSIDNMKEIVLNYVIKEYIDDEDVKINYETKLISSGVVDSFSMVSLLVFLEKQFEIKIPSSKATPEAFDTVNNIVTLVSQYLN